MKNYWTYFIASLISLIGSNYFIFTQGWYVLKITGENLPVGLTWSIFFLPSLLFLPIIGKILDSFDLKKVFISFEIAKLIIFLIFVPLLHYYPREGLVYLLAVLYGMAFAPYYPSVYVALKRLVPESHQTKYSHLFETSLQFANIVAVFSSGFLFEGIGFIKLLLLSAAFVCVGSFGMFRLKFDRRQTNMPVLSVLNGYTEFFRLFKKVAQEKVLSPKQFVYGIFHQFPQSIILVGNVPVLLYVNSVMKGGPIAFGIMDSFISIAALGVSIFWAKQHLLSERRNVILLVTIPAALAVMAMGKISPSWIWPYLWMLVYGALLISSKILARAAVVRIIPKEQVGIFSTLFQTCGYMVMLLLFLGISTLSRYFEPKVLFYTLGLGLFLYGFAIIFLFSDFAAIKFWRFKKIRGAQNA